MKVGIFTESKDFYPPKRFKEEAESMKIDLDLIQYSDLLIKFEQKSKKVLLWNGSEFNLSAYSHFIARGFSEANHLKNILLSAIKDAGIKMLNSSSYLSIIGEYNKLYQYYELQKHDLPVIKTYYSFAEGVYSRILQTEKDRKYIQKPINGTHGKGIDLANEATMGKVANNILMQEYIAAESTVRVIVLGDKVLGGMKKTIEQGKIASNSGEAESFEVDSQLSDLALKAAKALSLEFCGIDFIQDRQGQWWILEVNRMPSFKAFEESTNVNVAKKILEYLIKS